MLKEVLKHRNKQKDRSGRLLIVENFKICKGLKLSGLKVYVELRLGEDNVMGNITGLKKHGTHLCIGKIRISKSEPGLRELPEGVVNGNLKIPHEIDGNGFRLYNESISNYPKYFKDNNIDFSEVSQVFISHFWQPKLFQYFCSDLLKTESLNLTPQTGFIGKKLLGIWPGNST
jgi:hypothetical protein